MVNSGATNLKDSETQDTVGESKTITGAKRGDWHGYQIHDLKMHCVALSDTAVIIFLHTNIYNVTRPLQKGF